MPFLKNIAISFFLIISFTISGQNKSLHIFGIENLKLSYTKVVKDSNEAKLIGQQVIKVLHQFSYLTAHISSTKFTTDSALLYIITGNKIEWAKLRQGNLTDEELTALDFRSKLYLESPFDQKQLNRFFEKTVQYFENRGFPFVAVSLDSVKFLDQNKVSAALKITKNKFYKIDSLVVKGNSRIDKEFLQLYLGVRQGDPYNEFKIKNISTRLSEIPFIQSAKKPEIQYFEEEVKIILNLKKKNASRFDGILGLLTNEETGKIEFTGDIDLNLINSFKKGERIGFNWRKLKGNSQELNIGFEMPYIFKSQFGTEFSFDLFKRDTTFLDLTTHIGFNYLLDRVEKVSLFLENKSSTLLSRNSIVKQNTINSPALGDVRINLFGINYQRNKTDYIYNPTKGLNSEITFSAGRKRLRKISALELENPNIYNNVKLNTNQFQARIFLDYYLRINSRNTIKLSSKTATINSENIYTNELLRIGGLRILRGFDEESINASTYNVNTFEYRYLLDRNSYFALFYDQAFYENNNVDGYSKDSPFGIGAGVSFETNSGIFTFNYAVGKHLNNPIQFRAAKIHFGFVNFF